MIKLETSGSCRRKVNPDSKSRQNISLELANCYCHAVKVTALEPERQKKSESIIASISDTISNNKSKACPVSDLKIEDDRKAADKGRKPLSCLQ